MAPPNKEMKALRESLNKTTIALNNLRGTNEKQLAETVYRHRPGAPTSGPDLPGGGPRSQQPTGGSRIEQTASDLELAKKERTAMGGLVGTAVIGAAFKGGKEDKGRFGIQDLLNLVRPGKSFQSLKKAAKETGDVMVAGFEEVRDGVEKFDKGLGDVNRRYGLFIDSVEGRGDLGQLLLTPLIETSKEGVKTVKILAELGITQEDVTKTAVELGTASNALRSIFSKAGSQFDDSAVKLTQLAAVFKKAGVEEKNFGTLSTHVSKTFGEMWKGSEKVVKGTKQLQTQLHALAQITGQDVNVVTNEFNASLENLAFVGMQDALDKFVELKTVSETTGISMENIVKTASKFDDFKSAGQSVGQLNAMLRGNYLNSREFMAASGDRAKQEKILQAAIVKAHKAGTFTLSEDAAVRFQEIRSFMAATGSTREDMLKRFAASDKNAAAELAKLQDAAKKRAEKEIADKDPAKREAGTAKYFDRMSKAIEQNLSMSEKQALLAEKNMQQFVKGAKDGSAAAKNLQDVLTGSIAGIDAITTKYLEFFKPLNKQMAAYSKMKAITGTRGVLGVMLFGDEKGIGIKSITQFLGAVPEMQKASTKLLDNFHNKIKPGSPFRESLDSLNKQIIDTAVQLKQVLIDKAKLRGTTGEDEGEGEGPPRGGTPGPDVKAPPRDSKEELAVYHIHVDVDKKQFTEFVLETTGKVIGVRV